VKVPATKRKEQIASVGASTWTFRSCGTDEDRSGASYQKEEKNYLFRERGRLHLATNRPGSSRWRSCLFARTSTARGDSMRGAGSRAPCLVCCSSNSSRRFDPSTWFGSLGRSRTDDGNKRTRTYYQSARNSGSNSARQRRRCRCRLFSSALLSPRSRCSGTHQPASLLVFLGNVNCSLPQEGPRIMLEWSPSRIVLGFWARPFSARAGQPLRLLPGVLVTASADSASLFY
jgi:hypothetical protein